MPGQSSARRIVPHLIRLARQADEATSDAQLLADFVRTKSQAAFTTIVRRHGPMVFGVCRRVVGDEHLAEDAFQAVFLVLARRAGVVRERLGPWLYGVAYRTALKARGTAARRSNRERQVDPMPHPTVSPAEVWADLQPVLDDELSRLPEKYRVPIVLCDLMGRPQREIARELKVPPATLATRLAAARRLLAQRLTARGVALSAGAVAAALAWHQSTAAVPPALSASAIQSACQVVAGQAVGAAAPVVQLSEGVMRMFVIAKLRAATAGVVAGVLVLFGLGLAVQPRALAEPKDAGKKADPRPAESDDAQWLRRTSLDIRNTLPSILEVKYFTEDRDPKKREKVTGWLVQEHGQAGINAACARCHVNAPKIVDFVDSMFDLGAAWPNPPMHGTEDWLNYVKRLQLQPKSAKDGDDSRVKTLARLKEQRVARANELGELNATFARSDGSKELARLKSQAEDLGKQIAQLTEMIQSLETSKSEAARLQASRNARSILAAIDAGNGKRPAIDPYAQIDRPLHRPHSNAANDPKAKAADLGERVDEAVRRNFERMLIRGPEPTDADFIRRLSLDFLGLPPSRLEVKYFEADTDPKKREKLIEFMSQRATPGRTGQPHIDEFLADPEVKRRYAEWSKQKALAAERAKAAASRSRPLSRLVAELVEAKKSDEQILEALCLATMARYPTDSERTHVLDGVRRQSNRLDAWDMVAFALSASADAKAHAAALAGK